MKLVIAFVVVSLRFDLGWKYAVCNSMISMYRHICRLFIKVILYRDHLFYIAKCVYIFSSCLYYCVHWLVPFTMTWWFVNCVGSRRIMRKTYEVYEIRNCANFSGKHCDINSSKFNQAKYTTRTILWIIIAPCSSYNQSQWMKDYKSTCAIAFVLWL